MNVEDIARQRRRCDWCGRFVTARMPQFTWQRGPGSGWTTPRTLCPDCAEYAYDWPLRGGADFAELAVGL